MEFSVGKISNIQTIQGGNDMCFDPKKKLLKEIKLILSKTVWINSCIIYYKQSIEAKKEQPDKYGVGENFFNSATFAFDYLITCELWKLYNKKEEKGSLYSILRFCKNNNLIFNDIDEYTDAQKRVEEKDIKVLKTYRSKYFAHCDKKFFGQETKLLEEYSYDLDSFDALNKYAIELLIEIYGKIADCDFVFNPNLMTGFDFKNILINLK